MCQKCDGTHSLVLRCNLQGPASASWDLLIRRTMRPVSPIRLSVWPRGPSIVSKVGTKGFLTNVKPCGSTVAGRRTWQNLAGTFGVHGRPTGRGVARPSGARRNERIDGGDRSEHCAARSVDVHPVLDWLQVTAVANFCDRVTFELVDGLTSNIARRGECIY